MQRPGAPGRENGGGPRETGECRRCHQRCLGPQGPTDCGKGGGALGREGCALGCVLCDGLETCLDARAEVWIEAGARGAPGIIQVSACGYVDHGGVWVSG